MPNTSPSILREDDVKKRLELVPDADKGRYFLYVGATKDEAQLLEAISLVKNYDKVIGLKLFAGKSTGDLAVLDESDQLFIYKTLSENDYKGVFVVHCEKESFMKYFFDPKNPITHAKSRPNIAEVESIKDQIKFAKETNFEGTLHICHVSCKDSLQIIKAARNEIKITCGATPHHLLWDDSKLDSEYGSLFKMNPPLRSKEDVLALREGLVSGDIDWIETDHAPHTIGEKLHEGYPSGYPSLYLYKELIETFLPNLGLSDEQIKKLTFDNIVNSFNLNL